jgi:dipeptidyl aminopeptidase/acylaminoacyl peptidase
MEISPFHVAIPIAAFFGLRAALHLAIRVSLKAPRLRENATPAALGLCYETVRIPTHNDKRLHGWLIPAGTAGPAPAVIVLHGWGGNAQFMLPLARPLHQAGFATLFIDARCHGLSDGDSFASLPRFAEDATNAWNWLTKTATPLPGIDADRIALVGHSVGAGAMLLTAAQRGGAAAVVSIAAFAHPADMMRRWLVGKRLPEVLAGYVLGYVERAIAHRFDDIAPVRSIGRVDCPVLLVHGEADAVVPLDDARRLFASGQPGRVELLSLPGDHECFPDVERELAAVVAFLCRASGIPVTAGGANRQA